jgi:predicted ATPase
VLHGLNWGLSLFQLFRDDASLEAMAEEALNLATEQGFPDYQSAALMMRGWSLSRRGNAREGVELIRSGLAERQSRGTILGRRYYLSLLACAERQAGNTSAGIAAVDEALGAPHANIDVWLEPELMRIRGELLLDSGATMRDEAERCFRGAIESARATESPGWELRSAVSLARLVSEQGRRREARHLLEPVYGWFTEGFDTPDLLDAKTLLSQIT